MLTYDVVIATRNRPEVLLLAVRSLLAQTYPPAQIIVVDGSDSPWVAPVTLAALGVTETTTPTKLLVRQGTEGVNAQRNAGLDLVTAPLVFFSDDDALWHPAAAEAVVRIYACDAEERVAGVAPAQATRPPGKILKLATKPYRLRVADWLSNRLGHWRSALESLLVPNPFVIYGRELCGAHLEPAWLAHEHVRPVPWMAGFRMTFRTECIRAVGFDQRLYQMHYPQFEDVEVCFQLWPKWLIVGTHAAEVYHYRHPGERLPARDMGFIQLLNRAYIVCKHTPPGSAARRALWRYSYYKLLGYGLWGWTRRGRQWCRGAWAARDTVRAMARAPSAAAEGLYDAAVKKYEGA